MCSPEGDEAMTRDFVKGHNPVVMAAGFLAGGHADLVLMHETQEKTVRWVLYWCPDTRVPDPPTILYDGSPIPRSRLDALAREAGVPEAILHAFRASAHTAARRFPTRSDVLRAQLHYLTPAFKARRTVRG